jgi:hypothetical protein
MCKQLKVVFGGRAEIGFTNEFKRSATNGRGCKHCSNHKEINALV